MGIAARTLSVTVTLPAALSCATIDRLQLEFQVAFAEPSPVVVLQGENGIFCEGMDLSIAGAGVCGATRSFVELLVALTKAPKPLLSFVDGVARGGGLGILCASDVVLCTPQSEFSLPEALYGFLPAAIFPLILDRLSPQKLRLLIVDGLSRGAEWAERNGLVDEIVASETANASVSGWVRRLARTSRAGAVPALRSLCARNSPLDVEGSIKTGAAETAAALSCGDLGERIRTFAASGLAPWDWS